MALTGFSNSPGQILLNTDFPRSLHQQSSFGLKQQQLFFQFRHYVSNYISDLNFQFQTNVYCVALKLVV